MLRIPANVSSANRPGALFGERALPWGWGRLGAAPWREDATRYIGEFVVGGWGVLPGGGRLLGI